MVLDIRSVHVADGFPASTTGPDPVKRAPGRKRGLAVDVLGLVIAITVLAADAHDNAAGLALLDQVTESVGGTVRKALVDQGSTGRPSPPSPPSPTGSPPRPPRPTCPSVWTTRASSPCFKESTDPLWARDVCEALDHELLPKNIEGTRAKLNTW